MISEQKCKAAIITSLETNPKQISIKKKFRKEIFEDANWKKVRREKIARLTLRTFNFDVGEKFWAYTVDDGRRIIGIVIHGEQVGV